MAKTRVLLTGASGSMGYETFKVLFERRDAYDLVLFLEKKKREKKLFSHHEDTPGIRIVWGDLGDSAAVRRAVKGVDRVLHPAALISPAADRDPAGARRSNAVGTKNLVEAVLEEPDGAERIRLVSIGSVAQYGDRLPPHHRIQVGDPVRPAVGDYYSVTKSAAELAVIESGLRHWASIRQTYIAIPNTMTLMDPIMFHQPLGTHIELITAEDAGYGLAQCLEVPDEFFGRVYNMSGGPRCRVVYSDYLEQMMNLFGLGDYRKIMERRWFALRNFHCGHYEDGHLLNEYLGHWRQSVDDHYAQADAAASPLLKLGSRLAPPFIVRQVMRELADPIRWLRAGDVDKIEAFLGSRSAWEAIPGWGAELATPPAGEVELVDYASKSDAELAEMRGGRLVSSDSEGGKLELECGHGHSWTMSSAALRAGYFCPTCAPLPWDESACAETDPLFAKYHYATHSPEERQRVRYLFAPVD